MSTEYSLKTVQGAPFDVHASSGDCGGSVQITLPIKGMTCMGCVAGVQLALGDLPGVQDVTVDLGTRQAQVTYDPAQVGPEHMVAAVAQAGYQVVKADSLVAQTDRPTLRGGRPGEGALSRRESVADQASPPWRRPLAFGLLGSAGLLILYLGLVSLAQGWEHAVSLLAEDAWVVGPILIGFGLQVGLYAYLKTVIHAAARGAGALTGAGGGTSTAAMVACCAHHAVDVLPLVGLTAAATFLAEYRIPFMLVGLASNLVGIGVMVTLVLRQRQHLAECSLKAQVPSST